MKRIVSHNNRIYTSQYIEPMKDTLEQHKQTLLYLDSIENLEYLVQYFELIESKLYIDTIQGIANIEGKSFNGIKKSKRYRKTKVGSQKMAIKGLNENKLPW